MKTGIVLSLAVSGTGNKIFTAGDAVNENRFPKGNWDRLVKEKHIKEDVAEGAAALKDEETTPPPPPPGDEDHGSENKIISIEDISRKQIIKDLTAAEKEFDKTADKEVLFDLWKTLEIK